MSAANLHHLDGAARIPKNVTIPGEEIASILVMMLDAEADFVGGDLSNAICSLYQAAFGRMYLDCECDKPECPICNGRDEGDGATPLYRLLLERSGALAA